MPSKLTTASVLRFTPHATKRREIADHLLPGFYLVIQKSGLRSWAVRYRHRGQTRKLTLARVEVLDLARARRKAREALQAVASGEDPCADKREPRRPAPFEDAARDLVATQFESYLT